MKTIKYLFFGFIAFLNLSCSNDEDNSANDNSANVYLPISIGNFWTYDVTTDNAISRDSLYVSNDTIVNGNVCKKFRTLSLPTGFYSTSLYNNCIRKDGSKLYLNGGLGLSENMNLPIDLNLNLSDFLIFNENAVSNTTLGTFSGTIQQTVQGYPLTINYSLVSKAGENYSSYTSPNSDVYSNVKSSKISLSVSIITYQELLGNQIPITLLSNQEVLNSTIYLAKDIGTVHVHTTQQYNMNSLPVGINLPFPSSGSQIQNEFLDTYDVN